MRQRTPQKRGAAWVALGALLLAGAAALSGWNLWAQKRAADTASLLLAVAQAQQLVAQGAPDGALPAQAAPPAPAADPASPEEASLAAAAQQIDGVLSLPTLGLELPVLAGYSEELLQLSPCVYQRAGEGGRLVIAGHNYRSHFGRLGRLKPGYPAAYQPQQGEPLALAVRSLEEIGADDRNALEAGEWTVTLLTCNLDQSRRLLVRLGPPTD